MNNQEGEIRIYLACLAAYNNCHLHGCWINADQEADDIWKGIAAILAASPIEGAEEWAIHDYEGFEGVPISECAGLESVSELAAFITEHGTLGGKLVEYFGSLADAREALEDRYYGEYQRLEDFVQESTENQYEIPEGLRY